ncbi:hypothetical protein [Janthinobacterium sp. NKUCC06_STL]|uniref:hypothetical protein n=1 Tax=Janthinobacterium sp. NKUCC06_STL TaxID=2842127 RepID=UPI001C5B9119|nr:hypothetical protein [Janthinobacterium sp. NKUCC06_STL]MBW3510013.1 hypothetical protein [Janthinobacterium sp. NKUCC06_STL]
MTLTHEMLAKGPRPVLSEATAQVLLVLLKQGKYRQHGTAMRRPGFLDTAISIKWGKVAHAQVNTGVPSILPI